jgi:hypothetical protein
VSEDPLALVPLPDAHAITTSAAVRIPSAVLGGMSLVGMVAIACLIASPLSSLWAVAALTGTIIAASTIPWRRRGGPRALDAEDIADPELRAGYRALLSVHHFAALRAPRRVAVGHRVARS